MKKVLLLFSLLFTLAVFLSVSSLKRKKRIACSVEIPKGSSCKFILKNLEKRRVLNSFWLPYVYCRVNGIEPKAGCYVFNGNFSATDIIKKFSKGSPCYIEVTIPEGEDIYYVNRSLHDAGICRKNEVLLLSSDKTFLSSLGIPCLEGFMFPDTYKFVKGQSCKMAITEMVSNFKQRVLPLFCSYKPPNIVVKAFSKVTPEKLLILASIIERETSNSSEKPLIAGVFYNRLIKGMKLQSDPTVFYAYKKMGIFKEELHKGDTDVKSPFNTYYIKGLPSTPICNPGIDSILAAMHPVRSGYLYFVARKDRKGHYFSKSYNEQLKILRKEFGKKAKKVGFR